MGCEAQPHGPALRRDNVVPCLISLGKHMLAVSNIYFIKKKYVWSKAWFFKFSHIKPIELRDSVVSTQGAFPTNVSLSTHHPRTSWQSNLASVKVCLSLYAAALINGDVVREGREVQRLLWNQASGEISLVTTLASLSLRFLHRKCCLILRATESVFFCNWMSRNLFSTTKHTAHLVVTIICHK